MAVTTVVEEAAVGGGALLAGEQAAGAIALVPIPGARVVAGAVALGTLVGVGLGFLFGQHDTPEDRARKAREGREHIVNKYEEVQAKYEQAYAQQSLNLDSLSDSLLDPASVLTSQEVEFMNAHSEGKFFEAYESNVTHAWQTERRARSLITSINQRRAMDPFFTTDRLAGDELAFLHARHPQMLAEIDDTHKSNMGMIKRLAQEHNADPEELMELYGSRVRSSITEGEFQDRMGKIQAAAPRPPSAAPPRKSRP